MDDDGLVAALLSGSDTAARELVTRHSPWMLAVSKRILRDPVLAEDCVQEALIAAITKIATFEGRSSLKSWLHRILMNQSLMKLRVRKRRSEDSIDDLLPEFYENGCRIEEVGSQYRTPEEILGSRETVDLVKQHIEQLPESYRIVLQLRDIEEMTTAEVADALELTETNVKVRLHRARSALKSLLEPVMRGGGS